MNPPLALIITFNPNLDFFQYLPVFFKEFSQVLIIDNSSKEVVRTLLTEKRTESLEVILNQENLGVATALNQGLLWAIDHGFDYVVTFDQDSYPQAGIVQHLENVLTEGDPNELAVVASVIKDPQLQKQARFLRARNKWLFEWGFCKTKKLENISFAITAGSLYSLKAYQKIGPFQDGFFIDYVDQEYCLRANQHGYKIVAACDAHLNHRLGEREKRKLAGRMHYPTFHAPLRWYYISRNRIFMLRKYAFRFPHWFFYDIVARAYIFWRMLLFEDQRVKKLIAIFFGTRDGILGHMGKASNKIQKKLS